MPSDDRLFALKPELDSALLVQVLENFEEAQKQLARMGSDMKPYRVYFRELTLDQAADEITDRGAKMSAAVLGNIENPSSSRVPSISEGLAIAKWMLSGGAKEPKASE